MDWAAVGDWALGLADSTLVVGLVGAGAALLGGTIANRRAVEQRREDQRREDVAAWRDKRHEAYAEMLSTLYALEAASSSVAGASGRLPDSDPELAVWGALASEVETELGDFEEEVARYRLITSKELHEILAEAVTAAIGVNAHAVWLQRSSDGSPAQGIPHDSVEQVEELAFQIHDLRTRIEKTMRQELGLPKDE